MCTVRTCKLETITLTDDDNKVWKAEIRRDLDTNVIDMLVIGVKGMGHPIEIIGSNTEIVLEALVSACTYIKSLRKE